MHHSKHQQSENDHQKINKWQRETLQESWDSKSSMIYKNNQQQKDSLFAHCESNHRNNDESTIDVGPCSSFWVTFVRFSCKYPGMYLKIVYLSLIDIRTS